MGHVGPAHAGQPGRPFVTRSLIEGLHNMSVRPELLRPVDGLNESATLTDGVSFFHFFPASVLGQD